MGRSNGIQRKGKAIVLKCILLLLKECWIQCRMRVMVRTMTGIVGIRVKVRKEPFECNTTVDNEGSL